MAAKATYNVIAFAENLENLMKKKREQQARAIMDAFLKSDKDYRVIMSFLNIEEKMKF